MFEPPYSVDQYSVVLAKTTRAEREMWSQTGQWPPIEDLEFRQEAEFKQLGGRDLDEQIRFLLGQAQPSLNRLEWKVAEALLRSGAQFETYMPTSVVVRPMGLPAERVRQLVQTIRIKLGEFGLLFMQQIDD